MDDKKIDVILDEFFLKGPQSTLEKKYIEEYLLGKGYQLKDLKELPREQARQLMKEACTYASNKLAEVESRSRLKQNIRFDA